MNKQMAEIKSTAAEIAMEETTRIICPWCKGGSSEEKSMVVSKVKNGILFNCHRATCLRKGSIPSFATDGECCPIDSKPIIRVTASDNLHARMRFEKLPESVKMTLMAKYNLEEDDLRGMLWVVNFRRFWMPLYNRFKHIIGGVARSLDDTVKPKTLTVLNSTLSPLGSFYWNRDGDTSIWIVEDQLSAIRASKYVSAVALCGSHLSEGLIADIAAAGVKSVTIALDKDAFGRSLAYQRKYSEFFESCLVHRLDKDIKNLRPEELETLIAGAEIIGKGLV